MKKILIVALAMSLFGCDYFQPKDKPEALARVGESFLFKKDIEGLGVQNLSPEDSSKVVDSFVGNWVMKQSLLQNAGSNLTQQQLFEVEKKVLDYRESLVSHLYETKIAKQRIDTVVTDEEINEYFETHKEDFVVDEPVIRFFSIKSDKGFTQSKVANLNKWLKNYIVSGNDAELAEICSFEAIDCFSDIDSYVPLSTFYETFGGKKSTKGGVTLKKDLLMKYQKDGYHYLYQVIDLKTSGTYPESYVKGQITKLILRKREQQFLEELRMKIYETAKIKNQIEIYD